jgi:pseudomonalisin
LGRVLDSDADLARHSTYISTFEENVYVSIRNAKKVLFRNRLTIALSLALAGVGTVSSAAVSQSAPAWAPTSSRVVDMSRAAVGAPVEDSYPVSIVVNLKLRNENVMDSFIGELHRPGSPAFHQFLSSEQATANFSATAEQAQAVADYLTAQGFKNVQIAPNRLLVSADGNAAAARRAFNTDFVHLSLNGEEGIANTRGAQVPTSIADQVQGVLGLQTVQKMHTFLVMSTHSGTSSLPSGHSAGSSDYLPSEFSTVYHAGTMATASNTAVAVLGWGDMSEAPKDLAQYESDAGITKTTTNVVAVGASTTSTGEGPVEWAMDGQAIIGTSGGVKSITYYEGDDSASDAALGAVVNRVVSDNIAKVANMSFGECEIGTNTGSNTGPYDTYLKTGVTQGQTFSAASGDWGAYPCNANGSQVSNGTYGDTLGVSYPSSSPYVVTVGGTTLTATSSDAYTSEAAWAYGGGGISSYEALPSWQKSAGLSGSYRQVPDVAFDADGSSGMTFYCAAYGGYIGAGGTSLASPLFVGAWSRLESANNNGLGFANPGLYAYSGTFPFHDVTTGKNGYYSAGVGYDNATGWGSFDIQAAANFITNNPGFVSDTNGNGGGGSTAARRRRTSASPRAV